MDMKKILQAMEGASTKPVEGSNDMKRFLRAVTEADVNQPAALPAAPKFYITQTTYDSLNEPPDFSVTDLQRGIVVKSFDSEQEARAFVAQQDPAGAAQTELHQVQSKATAPEANPDAAPQAVAEEVGMDKLLSIVNESKGPLNRLSTAESMVMQTAAKKKTVTNPVLNVSEDAKPSMIGKYFKAVEQEIAEAADRSKDRARQLAERVINRVLPEEAAQETPLQNPADSVSLDVPLLIRLMEFAREDAADDMALHSVTEKLIALSANGDTLTMDNYEEIVGEVEASVGPEEPVAEKSTPFAGAKVGQKAGKAGQLRGKDKVDVKGTVLGSKPKSQKGLRGKLVGGGS